MPARPGLTRTIVLDAAIALVDADGLAALTMRRLGERLGVEAMSLYRHVHNKADLLDGIHDALLGRIVVPPGADDWAADLRALARAFRDVLRDHAQALPLFATRSAVGPQALAQVEAGLQVLTRAGIDPLHALPVFQVVFAFVVGHSSYTYGPTQDETVVDYGTLDPDQFPHLQRIPQLAGRLEVDAEFELGLTLLIEGIRAQLIGHRPG